MDVGLHTAADNQPLLRMHHTPRTRMNCMLYSDDMTVCCVTAGAAIRTNLAHVDICTHWGVFPHVFDVDQLAAVPHD
jgi:hypothetical protein